MPQTLNSPKEVAIAAPFSIDAYGNVAKATTPERIWAGRVFSVLATAIGERVFRPSFGTNLHVYLMDTQSVAEEVIDAEIRKAFNVYLPSLEILTLDYTFNESDKVFYVDLTYKLPNNLETTTTVGIATISGNGPATEELL